MIHLYSRGSKIVYDIDHYVVETITELKTLSPENMGDTAFVLTENKLFMADSALQWWLIKEGNIISPPDSPSSLTAILGKAILGKMILGRRE